MNVIFTGTVEEAQEYGLDNDWVLKAVGYTLFPLDEYDGSAVVYFGDRERKADWDVFLIPVELLAEAPQE